MADVDRDGLCAAADRLAAGPSADTEVIAVPTDVSRWESVESLAAQASDRFGAVHVLCNNAGVQRPGGPVECTLEAWNWARGREPHTVSSTGSGPSSPR